MTAPAWIRAMAVRIPAAVTAHRPGAATVTSAPSATQPGEDECPLTSFCHETPVLRGSTAPLRSRLGKASLISRDLLLSPDREGGVLARRVGVSRQKLTSQGLRP